MIRDLPTFPLLPTRGNLRTAEEPARGALPPVKPAPRPAPRTLAEAIAEYHELHASGEPYYIPLALIDGTAATASAPGDTTARRKRLQAHEPTAGERERGKLLEVQRSLASLPAGPVAAAARALAWCAADLAMPAVPLAYFDTAFAPLTRGFYQDGENGASGEIWVNACELHGPRATLLTTIAHEARHAWQARTWPAAQYANVSLCEQDASAYAARVVNRIR